MSPIVGVLFHDDDNRTSLTYRRGRCVDDLEAWHLMIIYTSDVDCLLVLIDNVGIVADDAPVCSPIYQGTSTFLDSSVLGNSVTHPGLTGMYR